MDLNLALKLSQSTYLRAKTRNADEDTLDLLRAFIDDTQTLIDKAMIQSQPQMPGMPPVDPAMAGAPTDPAMDPMAVPEAAPTSDILPV